MQLPRNTAVLWVGLELRPSPAGPSRSTRGASKSFGQNHASHHTPNVIEKEREARDFPAGEAPTE